MRGVGRTALLAAVAARSGAVSTASQLAERAADIVTRPVLPVPPALAALLPAGGLQLGTTVAVRGSRSVLLSLLTPTTDRGWTAVVGMPDLGLLAARECGLDTSHLALIPHPGAQVGEVVAALLNGIPLVALAADGVLGAGQRGVPLARRLSARARNRGAVLVVDGRWPVSDLQLECSGARWDGLGERGGYLERQEITVTVTGRGGAHQARTARLRMPFDRSSRPVLSAGQRDAVSQMWTAGGRQGRTPRVTARTA